jgi:hypothetical protein
MAPQRSSIASVALPVRVMQRTELKTPDLDKAMKVVNYYRDAKTGRLSRTAWESIITELDEADIKIKLRTRAHRGLGGGRGAGEAGGAVGQVGGKRGMRLRGVEQQRRPEDGHGGGGG